MQRLHLQNQLERDLDILQVLFLVDMMILKFVFEDDFFGDKHKINSDKH